MTLWMASEWNEIYTQQTFIWTKAGSLYTINVCYNSMVTEVPGCQLLLWYTLNLLQRKLYCVISSITQASCFHHKNTLQLKLLIWCCIKPHNFTADVKDDSTLHTQQNYWSQLPVLSNKQNTLTWSGISTLPMELLIFWGNSNTGLVFVKMHACFKPERMENGIKLLYQLLWK